MELCSTARWRMLKKIEGSGGLSLLAESGRLQLWCGWLLLLLLLSESAEGERERRSVSVWGLMRKRCM